MKISQDELFEMAKLSQVDTGLPVVVFIYPGNTKHTPRIKVQKDYSRYISPEVFAITIEDVPKVKGDTGKIKGADVELIKKWVLVNKNVLLDYWFQKETSLRKILNSLKTLTGHEQDTLLEINYGTAVTGLPMVIWVGASGGAKYPVIKIQRTYSKKMTSANLFSVTISDSPKIKTGDQGEITNADLQKVCDFVILNKGALLKLWREKYVDFDEFKKHIQKV